MSISQRVHAVVVVVSSVGLLLVGALPVQASETTSGGSMPPDAPTTSIVHAPDGATTTVRVNGLGRAADASGVEGRRMAHSDLQPAGRFVRAGESLTLTVPPGAPATSVRVGLHGTYAAHNDGRMVGYDRTVLQPGRNTVVAAHDGMVAFESTATHGAADVVVRGGEPVPTYVRGATTDIGFRTDMTRWPDAPFVEIVSEHAFGDFQRAATGAHVAVDDLGARTANWDRVIDLTNRTYGLDERATGLAHKHAHRIQIASPDSGAGYASASAERIVFQVGTGAAADLFRLPIAGQWALWHEIGHTYESPVNTFPGTAETITNISSLAVQEGQGFGNRWDESTAAFRAYFAGADRDWERAHDRVRLLAWEQLRRAFGDDFLPRFFQQLRVESQLVNAHVRTVDERRALFVTTAAATAHRDLTPFYDALGFPMSDDTRRTLGQLPPLAERIWDNVDSRQRIVEDRIDGYDPPVGTARGAIGPVEVGRAPVEPPVVDGLGTAGGTGSAVVVGAVGIADEVGPDAGRVLVRLRGSDGTENALVVGTSSAGGDSVVVRGQHERVVGALWLDDDHGRLRWNPVTSYAAHTSWSGADYVAFDLRGEDGASIARAAVQGQETGAVLTSVFGDRPYRDGQFLLVTHHRPAGLAAYSDGRPVADGSLPQAFRIRDDHLVPVEREEIPGWAAVRALEPDPVDLHRATDTVVPIGVVTNASITRLGGTLVVHAPVGTAFAPGQRELAGTYRKPGDVWRPSANLLLRGGTTSDDGRTVTYQLATGAGFAMPIGAEMRWAPSVRTLADAPVGPAEVAFRIVGSAT